VANEKLPENIRRFIVDRIDSVELLQVLLLLHGNQAKEWTIVQIEQELRSSSSAIEKRLKDLYDRKVLVQDPANPNAHRYRPMSEQIAEVVDALAQYNKTHPYRLIELIYTRPMDALRSFSDAFRIKKED
jgi:hypothetical protein